MNDIRMVEHSDHWADSFCGNIRIVKIGPLWHLTVRGDGGQWVTIPMPNKDAALRKADTLIANAYSGY
jgi:hypothetical protein